MTSRSCSWARISNSAAFALCILAVPHIGHAAAVAFKPDHDTQLSGQATFSRIEITSDVTVTAAADLVLESDGDIVISGRLIAGSSNSSNTVSGGSSSSGATITLRAKGIIMIDGVVHAGDGESADPAASAFADGPDGGNVVIEAPLVSGRGEILGGKGGHGALGGRGGNGGTVRIFGVVESATETDRLLVRGGDGGAGGEDGGDGGDGGHVYSSPLTDGTPGSPGTDVIITACGSVGFPDGLTGQTGGNGGAGADAVGGNGGPGGAGTGNGRGGDGGRGGNAQSGCGGRGGNGGGGVTGADGGNGGVGGTATGGQGGTGGTGGHNCSGPGGNGGNGGVGGNATGGQGGKGGNGGDGAFGDGEGGNGGRGGHANSGAGGKGGDSGFGLPRGAAGSGGTHGIASAGAGGAPGTGSPSGIPGPAGTPSDGTNGGTGGLGWGCPAYSGNSVVIESKSVQPNAAGVTVGIFVSNQVEIVALSLPLDIRSLSGGAFWSSLASSQPAVPSGNRLGSSNLYFGASPTRRRFPTTDPTPCSGPVSNTYNTSATQPDFVSPDGLMFSVLSQATQQPYGMLPGGDPEGTSNASMTVTFNVNASTGQFIIDTGCVRPSNHLLYTDADVHVIVPSFTPGIITICGAAPGAPSLVSPSDGATNVPVPAMLDWNSVAGATSYQVQVDNNADFSSPIKDESTANTDYSAAGLSPLATYFWRVRSSSDCGTSDWSSARSFTTMVGPVHSVVVESKIVSPNATNIEVGVYIRNDEPLSGMQLPLELYAVTPGCYITGNCNLEILPTGRLAPPVFNLFNQTTEHPFPDGSACSGPHAHSFATTAADVDYTSPDAIMYGGVSIGNDLPAGEDAPGDPSLKFVFDVSGTPGTFEIDTCCVSPASNLAFISSLAEFILPSFTKGVITIASCACDCHADPGGSCDGVQTVLDVVQCVNVAFRNSASIPDPNTACPNQTTDVNCDAVTTVVDVVKMVNVAFRNGNPATEFCNPCP